MPDTESRLVLGIDTSTDVCAAVARGAEVLATAVVTDKMQHVEQATPLVHRVMREAGVRLADVDLITVGLGPGPFTGLRVGIATAQILASVRGVPLHGVCSLDVIAQQCLREVDPVPAEFLVASDARRKEVYWARYSASGQRLEEPTVGAPESVPDLPLVGPAADLYPDRLPVMPGPRGFDAGTLCTAGPDLPGAGTEPLYLRRPDAAEPSRPKSVLVRRPDLRAAGLNRRRSKETP